MRGATNASLNLVVDSLEQDEPALDQIRANAFGSFEAGLVMKLEPALVRGVGES